MSSGSADSAVAVNPTRSQNSAVTTFRSSVIGAASDGARRDPQPLQNRESLVLSIEQTGQRTIRGA